MKTTGLYRFHNAEKVIIAILMMMRYKIRLYTLPPILKNILVPYPWLLFNIYNVKQVCKYLDTYKEVLHIKPQAILVDVGVTRYWRKPRDKLPVDYDDDFWNKFWNAVDFMKSVYRESGVPYEIVIPDYPDDYSKHWGCRHALFLEECSNAVTNIDRTIENVVYIVSQDRKVRWLLSIQGYEEDPLSLEYATHELLQLREYLRIEKCRLAVGNICTSRKAERQTACIQVVRKYVDNFHVFGLSLSGFRKSVRLLEGCSWDSMAWNAARYPNLGMVQDTEQKLEYFMAFLAQVYHIMRRELVSN